MPSDACCCSLPEVLETFETRSEPSEAHDVADAVRKLAREAEAAGETPTLEMRAEWFGFTLTEDYVHDEGFTWGTYYGPLGVAVDRSGKRFESPRLEEITPDVIAYWEDRARTSRHPILRMRYADLVWECGRRVKQPAPADLPRVVIDTTLAEEKGGLFREVHTGRTRLVRALELGLRDAAGMVPGWCA